jgi:hypothetical protein
MVGDSFNFEDVFFRDLTVCVLDTLEGQIKWINRFTSGDVFVQVPIYYSLTGDERFLLDSFSDDIVSENRFIELNTDLIPRGHLTMTSFNIKSDEFANPNVWLRMVVENEFEIRKVLGKVRAVPITVNYDLEITLSSEIDTFKCSQAILDTLWIYRFMYFEHNFMNIDAVLTMPDTNSIEMMREKNLTSDNNIKLKCSFTVETYYPAFRRDRIIDEGYSREYGSGMSDGNGFALTGGVSDYFDTNDTNTVFAGGNTINTNTGGNTINTNSGNTINTNTGGNTNSGNTINTNSRNTINTNSGNTINTNTGGNTINTNTGGNTINTNTGGNTINTNTGGNTRNTNTGGSVNVNKVNTGTINSNERVGVNNNGGRHEAPAWVEGPFNPKNPLTPYGETASFYNTGANSNASDVHGTFAKDRVVVPKRSRWFNNILKARERASNISGSNKINKPGSVEKTGDDVFMEKFQKKNK